MDLHLPLRREYFDQIAAGKKLEEFRRCTPYWQKRLEGKQFDKLILTLGYPKKDDLSRQIVIPWRGYRKCTITHPLFGSSPVVVYAIDVSGAAA